MYTLYKIFFGGQKTQKAYLPNLTLTFLTTLKYDSGNYANDIIYYTKILAKLQVYFYLIYFDKFIFEIGFWMSGILS